MIISANKGLHRDTQLVLGVGGCALLLENPHHCVPTKHLQWFISLSTHCIHRYCDEVLWGSPSHLWPSTLCLLSESVHWGCCQCHPSHSPHTPGEQGHVCKNAVHWFCSALNTVVLQKVQQAHLPQTNITTTELSHWAIRVWHQTSGLRLSALKSSTLHSLHLWLYDLPNYLDDHCGLWRQFTGKRWHKSWPGVRRIISPWRQNQGNDYWSEEEEAATYSHLNWRVWGVEGEDL